MIRTHRLAAAVAVLLSLSVAPAIAQNARGGSEMDSSPVTENASAASTGSAAFQTVANPLSVVSLGLPDPSDLSLLAAKSRTPTVRI